MGGPAYNFNRRQASTDQFSSQSFDQTFKQQSERRMHESMDPKKALLRESRDNADNPETLPIILGLDITGSMQEIPHRMVKDGLPKMIGRLKELGIQSPAILFTGVGDSLSDSYPFQVGQFESGDTELDMWLTRTYIEGNGGGNGGESYWWPWYFAGMHVQTDAWEKRGVKGFIITIGNEPLHTQASTDEFQRVMNVTLPSASVSKILEHVREKWQVFHINVGDYIGRYGINQWKELLGDNFIQAEEKDIPNVIARIVADHVEKPAPQHLLPDFNRGKISY